jgi:hypothetical protein
MKIETKKVNNNLTFKVVNDTCYDTTTPDKVIEVLETARQNRTRIKVDYGHNDGQSWGEVNDITGYVGRSTGTAKIPLLVHNTRSMGGGALLTHCIVKIETSKGKRVLYQHPTYKPFKN